MGEAAIARLSKPMRDVHGSIARRILERRSTPTVNLMTRGKEGDQNVKGIYSLVGRPAWDMGRAKKLCDSMQKSIEDHQQKGDHENG